MQQRWQREEGEQSGNGGSVLTVTAFSLTHRSIFLLSSCWYLVSLDLHSSLSLHLHHHADPSQPVLLVVREKIREAKAATLTTSAAAVFFFPSQSFSLLCAHPRLEMRKERKNNIRLKERKENTLPVRRSCRHVVRLREGKEQGNMESGDYTVLHAAFVPAS